MSSKLTLFSVFKQAAILHCARPESEKDSSHNKAVVTHAFAIACKYSILFYNLPSPKISPQGNASFALRGDLCDPLMQLAVQGKLQRSLPSRETNTAFDCQAPDRQSWQIPL